MARQHDHAVVMRLAISLLREQLEQFAVVALVLTFTSTSGAGGRLAGKARRVHAGRTVQHINADARIVGERRQSGVPARMPRLGERVLDEREMRLVDFRHAERRLGNDLDIERRENRADLVELAEIIRRDDYSLHKGNSKRKGRGGRRGKNKISDKRVKTKSDSCKRNSRFPEYSFLGSSASAASPAVRGQFFKAAFCAAISCWMPC